MNKDAYYAIADSGIPADSHTAFIREPMDLVGMIYTLQLEWVVRGHRSPIKVNASRGHSAESNWKVSVRASGVNSSNTQTIMDYAAALSDAALFASKIDLDILEAAHQATVTLNAIESANKKKANDALLAKDPEMGAGTSKLVIDGLVEKIKATNPAVKFAVIECARRDGGWWNSERKLYILDFYGESNWDRKVRFRTMDFSHGGLPVLWDSSDRIARAEVVQTFGEGSQQKSSVYTFTDGVEMDKWWRANKPQ